MSTNNKDNTQKLLDAMEFINDEAIENADKKVKKKGSAVSKIGAAAACLALVGGGALMLSQQDKAEISPNGYSLVTAQYPKMAQYPSDYNDNEGYRAWNADKKEQKNAYADVDISAFYEKTLPQFLSGDENKLFSPANLYVALGMCAEISKGDTQKEILELTGSEDLEHLRENSNAVWTATYSDDGLITSHMASSVWLNNNIAYNDDTLLALADNYYTSTYYGDPSDKDYSAALRGWISQQTNGFLDSQISELEISSDSVMELVTTLYFKGRWGNEYRAENNTTAPFFTIDGEVECEYMNGSEMQNYYYGDKFSAIEQRIGFDSNMVFILPDEEYTTDDLLADSEAISFMTQKQIYNWEKSSYIIVNRTVPKFDISYNADLIDGLKALGVESMFDFAKADFTTVTSTPDIAITAVKHGVRVKIDEEGVEAGSYVDMSLCGAGALPDEEVDFVLDRPFIFVIKSDAGCPMFVGVVQNP